MAGVEEKVGCWEAGLGGRSPCGGMVLRSQVQPLSTDVHLLEFLPSLTPTHSRTVETFEAALLPQCHFAAADGVSAQRSRPQRRTGEEKV